MDYSSSPCGSMSEEEEMRRGPWTVEEDRLLIRYINSHGEGRWNSLARSAGLKRTGKSCRLRWLNYLRPDVRRGNITPEEQLLIIELHSRWGNRWSKIAQHLPGRTDNEIKNYWRTRVQKHAKQLRCDVNSKQFKDMMRYLWVPRLVERINAANNTEKQPIESNPNYCGTDPTLAQTTMGSHHSSSSSWTTSTESQEMVHSSSPQPQSAVSESSVKEYISHLDSWMNNEVSDDYIDQSMSSAGFDELESFWDTDVWLQQVLNF